MANSDLLGIWNNAIGNLGVKTAIASTTESSAEAAACARNYQNVVEDLLRETNWNFCRQRAQLTEVSSGAVWPPSWNYMYVYPSDCLAIRGFDIGVVGMVNVTEIPYEVGNDATAGKVIYLNTYDPTLIYTAYTYDAVDAAYEARFDSSFKQAVSWALAASIAGPLIGNAQIMQMANQRAAETLMQARVANGEEKALSSMDAMVPQSMVVRGAIYDQDWPIGFNFFYPWP